MVLPELVVCIAAGSSPAGGKKRNTIVNVINKKKRGTNKPKILWVLSTQMLLAYEVLNVFNQRKMSKIVNFHELSRLTFYRVSDTSVAKLYH